MGVDTVSSVAYYLRLQNDTLGAIAQLGERLHGMQEVSGSIPLSSTNSIE
ncbi:Protein of unknown function [Candidatus Hamiltonella defensa (Bemisia tabaci)]|nr:Protein of unknown function [Candidatus Hamiltonella defensa (Bemisia tabaci)]